ncbi:MAG: ribonuclease D [Sulfuricaulis sp.]
MPEALIQEPTALANLCEQLRGQPWIALDTEFMRTRTYYARLCLVQVATPETIACVDTVVLPTLEPLLKVVYSPQVLKVIHAARQDLEVFADIRGAPPTLIFDTQIAASLCGYDDQIGYGALVESITGHKLAKLHTRADWEARPLAPEQLHYAEDDVRYLRDVYLFLSQQLDTLGRRAWLVEECAALTDPGLYRNDPATAFRRLKPGHTLPPACHGVLRELAAWREHTAQQSNLPRGWVVADATLTAIALAAPANLETLASIAGLSAAQTRKWGNDILAAVGRGQAASRERLWDEPRRLDQRQQALYERLQAQVHTVAAQLKISSTLLAPRRELMKLIAGDMSGALARGWRRTQVGEELLQLCASQPGASAVY